MGVFEIISLIEFLWGTIQFFGILVANIYNTGLEETIIQLNIPPFMVNFGHFLSRYPLELIVINILWAAVALISVLPKKRIHRNEWVRMQRRQMFLVFFISIVISLIIKEWEIRFLRPKMDSLLRSPGIIEAFLAACLIQFAVVLTLVTL